MYSEDRCHRIPCTGLPQNQRNDVNDEVLDVDVSKKLADLGHEEREIALHDLHGVSDAMEETDELIKQKLEELDMELEKIAKEEAPSFHIAVQQSADYVKNLRLVFLRADSFDARKAARRMTRFFECKRSTFGEETLARDITWDDLTEREKVWFQKGSVQLLPTRDRSGRAVIFRMGALNLQEDVRTQLRLNLFVYLIAMKDEETQKHGIVGVQYSVGITRFSLEATKALMKWYAAIPLRRVATHLCFDNPVLKAAAKLLEYVMSREDARDVCRFRAHYGSHMECLYALVSFGITRDSIPVSPSGKLRNDYHINLLKQIQNRPYGVVKHSPAIVELIPGPMDVMLGRGRHGTNAPGNVRFKLFLQENMERYEKAGRKKAKGEIINQMVRELQGSGTRFIKKGGGGWVKTPDAEVRLKIAKALRNLRPTVRSSNTGRALNKIWDQKFLETEVCDGRY